MIICALTDSDSSRLSSRKDRHGDKIIFLDDDEKRVPQTDSQNVNVVLLLPVCGSGAPSRSVPSS